FFGLTIILFSLIATHADTVSAQYGVDPCDAGNVLPIIGFSANGRFVFSEWEYRTNVSTPNDPAREYLVWETSTGKLVSNVYADSYGFGMSANGVLISYGGDPLTQAFFVADRKTQTTISTMVSPFVVWEPIFLPDGKRILL